MLKFIKKSNFYFLALVSFFYFTACNKNESLVPFANSFETRFSKELEKIKNGEGDKFYVEYEKKAKDYVFISATTLKTLKDKHGVELTGKTQPAATCQGTGIAFWSCVQGYVDQGFGMYVSRCGANNVYCAYIVN